MAQNKFSGSVSQNNNNKIVLQMPITAKQAQELQKITNEKLKKMFDDKKQTPKLLIPKNLPTFIKSDAFIKFLQSVYEYCFHFNSILKQYAVIKQKIQGRVGDEASLLRKEKQQLGILERQVSYHYAAIILSFNTQCMEEEKRRSNFKDQVFFEALIYLVQRVIKQMFNRQQFLQIQQEINRLFRTNRYNLIKKRHVNDDVLHKYPALKQQKNKNKNNLTSILNRAPQRINAYKKYQKEKRTNSSYDYTATLGIPKQLNNPDMQQRSPLLCTWLPSRKSMLGDFSNFSNYNNNMQAVQKRSILNTISAGDDNSQRRTRMASLGNNLMNNNYSISNSNNNNKSHMI